MTNNLFICWSTLCEKPCNILWTIHKYLFLHLHSVRFFTIQPFKNLNVALICLKTIKREYFLTLFPRLWIYSFLNRFGDSFTFAYLELNTWNLVHTVPVYAPVRIGCLQTADRGEPGRFGTEFECVHIFPAVLRTRPGLGHTLITVCPGYAKVCDGQFPV